MRKYAPLLLAFALGFVLSHTSTLVQRAFADPPNCPPPPVLPEALGKAFGVSLVISDGSIPSVPDVWFKLEGENKGGMQQLDGMDCIGCVVDVNLLTYAGGQFKCERCAIKSKNGVFLVGAALNTFHMLQLVGAIPSPKPPEPNPNRPQVMTAALTNPPARLDWVSLAK